MTLELKTFQEGPAAIILARLRKAAVEFASDREYWALSLSAPTGAGKTVISAAVIEKLLDGDEDHPGGDPDAVVLWLTDQPSLNEQTKRKMIGASSSLGPNRLETLTPAFRGTELSPGRVYFLNIQKLSRNQPMVNPSDEWPHTIWDVVNTTIARRGAHFVLIIDEAHRGMGTRKAAEEERRTIVQRFILGWNATLEPVPVVLGISATPQRFDALVSNATDRVTHRTNIKAVDVNDSGLLKDVILLRHPEKKQAANLLMLKQAVTEWRAISKRWAAYCAQQKLAPVRPLVAVQVEDGVGSTLSRTDLDAVLQTLLAEDPSLDTNAVAHSFDLGSPIVLGSHTVRYVKPEDIEDDPMLRVVLFKTSLTTGWDCPRAEVMFSFRNSKEYVAIAQLVGRMVRTPLARRITSDPVLNTVSLYLPNYNRAELDVVVKRLRDNPDEAPPVDTMLDPVLCERNPQVPEEAFGILENLPTYLVPRSAVPSHVTALFILATRLAGDGLRPDALDVARSHLLAVLVSERARLDSDGILQGQIDEDGHLVIGTVVVRLDGSPVEVLDADSVLLDEVSVNALFRQAERSLRQGLAIAYLEDRMVHYGADPTTAKLEAFALASTPETIEALEASAGVLTKQWLDSHDKAIRKLDDAAREGYFKIQGLAQAPRPTAIELHDRYFPGSDTTWKLHLLSDTKGRFPCGLRPSEAAVVKAELAATETRAWYRNPTGTSAALRVPYQLSNNRWMPMYPDFVFFHEVAGKLRPSIVDPHGTYLADAADKARGMADYAETHSKRFHRIDMVTTTDGVPRRIDLKNGEARKAVQAVRTSADLDAVFESLGTLYW